MICVFVLCLVIGCAGSGSSSSSPAPTPSPVPSISSVSPATVFAGSGPTTITVNGTGFTSSTIIQVARVSCPTTYVSDTQVTALVPTNQLMTAGATSITASNGTDVSTGSIGLQVNNPVPTITSLNPASVAVGSAATTVTVTGANFVNGTTIQVNGSARGTTYVSATQVAFQLTISDQATTANLSITVSNPTPGGGTSPAVPLAVATAAATPVLNLVAPNQLIVNSAATTISVLGSGLTTRSVVQWNGTNLATTYSSCYVAPINYQCLRATVPASLLTSIGTANITVNSPTARPSVSNALQVTITYPPVPTLTSLSVNAGPVNSATSIGVSGTGFVSASLVMVNGNAVPTTFVSSTSLTANVPASALATPGVFPVTVVTPAPGGGTSTPLYFTAYVAVPNNSMVYSPATGLFYLSVPSAAGAPFGNTIVPVDPLTGKTGPPIPVGSEPNRLAITSDGRYLWVALDGAAAVRKVDLTTGTAGLQFPIGPSGSSTSTVAALAALPGAPDSVVVSTYYDGYTTPTGVSLSIYDSGVARPNSISFATYAPFPYALLVNGNTHEIYGPGQVFTSGAYVTYSYDANGVTQKFSTNSSLSYANNLNDDIQVVSNTLYTDYGQGVDAETGALLGTFYSNGTTVARGSITVDTALGKAFILDGSTDSFGSIGQSGIASATLRAFNVADYSAVTSAPPIVVSIPLFRADYQWAGPTGSRLTRWGSNGLAFHGTGGFVSLRSNLVQDLSSVNADVAVSVAAPSSANTGANVTFTATVTNNGPSAASGLDLVATAPSSGVLVSVVPSTGTCVAAGTVACNLGGLASGASININFTVQMANAGTATLSAQVSASETDTAPSNNSASGTTTVSGNAYNLLPKLTAISPAAIVSGSSDTQITLTGTGFGSGATVQLNGQTIQTTFISATQLQATVPAASLASLGWASISVSNPSPGGGSSPSLPLYVFSVLPVNASHIVYDPYSRKLIAGLSTGTSTLPANSLLTITPETASIGTSVVLANTPASLATTSDGHYLYALLPSTTAAGIARFNLLTQQLDFTASGFQSTGYNVGLRDLATLPGSHDTIAVDEGEYPGASIFDFDGVNKTATRRGAATGIYTGTCLTFPDSSRLFLTDLYSSGSLLKSYSVTPAGLVNGSYPYYIGATLQSTDCMKVDGNLLFGQAGGVSSLSGPVPTQTGTFHGMTFTSNYGAGIRDFAPDASLGRSFYLTSSSTYPNQGVFDRIAAFDIATYMPSGILELPFSMIEGSTGFTGVDMVRWGQDGLAVLSSGGNIYLVRGPIVVPGLMGTSTAPTLTSSSSTTLTHGSSNTLLTLTGTNFQPGVAVTWNGSYRATAIVSSTQITVAIPSSDLATPGAGSLAATNPNSPSSLPLSITVQ